MLGRTANGIFWMARYLERAENTARLLETGFRLALTRGQGDEDSEWQSILVSIGQDAGFREHHDKYSGLSVANWILRERSNPGSVIQMTELARNNARTVRTALTSEVWEATNEAWIVLQDLLSRPIRTSSMSDILTTIRRQSMLVRGAMDGTMLRNEIFNFARIGTFIERADNTARILDVKYYVLLPSFGWVGSSLDNAQWETVLRSVSGRKAYRWLHAGKMDPRKIANLLILDRRFPRSLAHCYGELENNMAGLAREYGLESPAHDLLNDTVARLERNSIGQILEVGLHEFINDFIVRNQKVAHAIATEYRFIA